MNLYYIYLIIFLVKKINGKGIIKINKNLKMNNVYRIDSLLSNYYFYIQKNVLILSNKFTLFHLIKIKQNLFYIKISNKDLRLGIDNNDNIIGFKKKSIENSKLIWKIINIDNNKYLIQNLFSRKFIYVIIKYFLKNRLIVSLIKKSINFLISDNMIIMKFIVQKGYFIWIILIKKMSATIKIFYLIFLSFMKKINIKRKI